MHLPSGSSAVESLLSFVLASPVLASVPVMSTLVMPSSSPFVVDGSMRASVSLHASMKAASQHRTPVPIHPIPAHMLLHLDRRIHAVARARRDELRRAGPASVDDMRRG